MDKTDILNFIKNSLWYSDYRVCGDFALEINLTSTVRCNKKSTGGGGDFPSEILNIYILYIEVTFYY